MCNIRKETWKKKKRRKRKEIYIYYLNKEKVCYYFFHLGEVRKSKRSWGCGEAGPPGWDAGP